MSINKSNPDYSSISYDDIINCKNLSDEDMKKEFAKLVKSKNNPNGFYGNKIIYLR